MANKEPLVTAEERALVLDYAKRRILSTLTEIYERCGDDLVESFYKTTSSMGIRARHARIYWAALSLYTVDPQNRTLEWLAQVITGGIFRVRLPGIEDNPDVYPISHAILFSNIDISIITCMELWIQSICAVTETTGRTADEVMDGLWVPDVIRGICRKAVVKYRENGEMITFVEIADEIFRGLGCDEEVRL